MKNIVAWMLAMLGPPLLGLVLVFGLPAEPSSTGSDIGFKMFPFAALALLILLATRLDGGGKRAAVIATGVLVTLACWAFLAIGLMAP